MQRVRNCRCCLTWVLLGSGILYENMFSHNLLGAHVEMQSLAVSLAPGTRCQWALTILPWSGVRAA